MIAWIFKNVHFRKGTKFLLKLSNVHLTLVGNYPSNCCPPPSRTNEEGQFIPSSHPSIRWLSSSSTGGAVSCFCLGCDCGACLGRGGGCYLVRGKSLAAAKKGVFRQPLVKIQKHPPPRTTPPNPQSTTEENKKTTQIYIQYTYAGICIQTHRNAYWCACACMCVYVRV